MKNNKTNVAGIAKALLAADSNTEIARLNIIIDVQQRQIRQLIDEKSDLLSEINALYRTGGSK